MRAIREAVKFLLDQQLEHFSGAQDQARGFIAAIDEEDCEAGEESATGSTTFSIPAIHVVNASSASRPGDQTDQDTADKAEPTDNSDDGAAA